MKIWIWLIVTVSLVASLSPGGCSSPPQPAVTTTVATATVAPSFAAKNVILMIGDGAGYNQQLAAQYFRGSPAVYQGFPVHVSVTTYPYRDGDQRPGYDPVAMWQNFYYSVASTTTDSAAAATAMASGVKTYVGGIGVDYAGRPVRSVLETAESLGKATGVVTTVPWSHATPAAFVAHDPDRDDYAGIARQMIQESAVDVIMGAGNPDFDEDGRPADKDPLYVGGAELWAQLTDSDPATPAVADADGDGLPDRWTVLQTRSEFEMLVDSPTPPKRVCATAQVYSTLQQAREGDTSAGPYTVPFDQGVPDLPTMVRGALNVLDADPDGLFLLVEGGAIDWACHANQTGRMIEEQAAFDETVEVVARWVEAHGGWDETLLIVTADHETGMLWGPGAGSTFRVPDFAPVSDNGEGVLPGVSWSTVGHTNQLVPLYADGPGSSAFSTLAGAVDPVRGPYVDNTQIARVILGAP